MRGMTRRGRALAAVLTGLAIASAAATQAAAQPCGCKKLPALEQELFEQEWLQHEFHEYALGNKTPPSPTGKQTSSDALAAQVLADFRSRKRSPAGGGRGRGGAPELGTGWENCSLVAYKAAWVKNPDTGKKELKYEETPFDEDKYRQKNCTELADYLIAHEQKHVDQCKKYGPGSGFDINNWRDYSAWDTEAYGAGIRNLRKAIAKLASECGWQGSTSETKKNPEDGEEMDVVPTLKEAKALAKALRKGKP